MIQFNLLPDVKLDYVKTRRTKRIVTMTAGSIAAGSLTVLILLFIAVNVVQRARLNSLNTSIEEQTKALRETPNLNKILTVQNQLNSLTGTDGLHSKKPQVTRLNGYLQQLTPATASIAEVEIDFATATITLSGSANNLATVNKFVDTLKFTNFKYATTADETTTGPAFKDVVLSTFAIAKDNKASYQIKFVFDPVIFDSSKTVTLEVPNTVTTRSATDKPLFDNLTVPLGTQ